MSAHVLTPGRVSVLGIARRLSYEDRTPYLDQLRARIIDAREADGIDVEFDRTRDALNFPSRTPTPAAATAPTERTTP